MRLGVFGGVVNENLLGCKMAKIYSYKKFINSDVTRLIRLPVFDGALIGTELATIGCLTYISIPDDKELPVDQHDEVSESILQVALDSDLVMQIKKHSPYCALIAARVIGKIRDRYSEDDESAMQNKMIADMKGIDPLSDSDREKIAAAYAYFKECREWGKNELAALGLA